MTSESLEANQISEYAIIDMGLAAIYAVSRDASAVSGAWSSSDPPIMPEPVKPEEKVEEKPVETPKVEPKEQGYDYKTDHNRPIEAIIKEPVIEPPKKEEKTEEKPPEPTLTENPLDEAKKYLEEQRKLDAETAKTEAEKTAKEITERTIKEQHDQTELDAKRKDELIPAWEKEGREPKDYNEIAKENRRITKLELKIELEEEAKQKKADEAKLSLEQSKQNEDNLLLTQNQIQRDMEELYEGNFIPRPKSGDPNDPGMKMQDELFKLGIKVNEDLKKAGKPTEPSIAKIFFLYGKDLQKVEQPAGADAPIAGARPANPEKEQEGYSYKRDHNKTYMQILTEAARAQNKIIN